jgi:GNAT superfamily N-acetyltransferase
MVDVRPFREEDAPAVHRMMTRLAELREGSTHQMVLKKEYNRFFKSYMLGLLDNPDAVVCVAEDDGQVVGYAVATRGRDQPFMKFSHVAVLNDMYVEEDHRNTGVGRQLLAALRTWAQEQNLDALEVQVFPEHEQEIDLLQKLGFFQYRLKMLCPLS